MKKTRLEKEDLLYNLVTCIIGMGKRIEENQEHPVPTRDSSNQHLEGDQEAENHCQEARRYVKMPPEANKRPKASDDTVM